MTVPSTARRAGPYTGNGSTTSFSFSFKTFAAGDLVVTRTASTGVETTLVLNSDYSVSLNVDQDASPGGTITYPITGSPLPAGYKLTIVGDLEYEQTTDLLGGGAFNARVIEDTFDRTVIQIQQLEERLDRALVAPVSDTPVDMTMPTAATRASKALGFNASGNPTQSASTLAAIDAAVTTIQTIAAASPGSSAGISHIAAGTNAVATTVQAKLRETVSVKDFGAVGDGVADDTAAIQAAIDSLASTGGVVRFPPGTYRIARNIGTNDRWGIKVTASNIKLSGDQATLRRYNTNISTYALAYPILLVGTPDSNVAAATENVIVEGFTFQGENTQHAISGGAPNDFRDAIYAKNTKNLVVQNNTFTAIDSAVITYQKPVVYDYANSVYYNTTKNYNSKFVNNTCLATSHAVVGRALIHAVTALGIDNLLVEGNYFEWCDDAVASDTTYDLEKIETDTFTPTVSGWSLGAVKRTGRGVVVDGNVFHNCSEHPLYLTGFEEVASNNKITSDVFSITATNDAIKTRSYGCSITGNFVSGYGAGVSCAAGALNITVSGNTIYIPSAASFTLGAIGVDSRGISTYIAARISAGYWSTYRPMSGLVFSSNSIQFPAAAQSPANTRRQQAFTVISDTSDANYPQGQIQGVAITGNSVSNFQVGVHITGILYKSVRITGNSFFGKPFTESGFSAGTTVDTRAVIQMLRDATDQLKEVSFTSNTVYGAKYLCASFDGGGSAGTLQMPWGFSDNKLDFVQNIATADFVGVAITTKFQGNTGIWFLDRTWGGTGLNNALYIDDASTGNTALRYSFSYSSGTGQVRFYTDDAGTFISF